MLGVRGSDVSLLSFPLSPALSHRATELTPSPRHNTKADQELRHEVLESLDSLTAEQTFRLARLGHERHILNSYGLPPSLENMTEEEAVALALMLSREQEGFVESGATSPEWEAVPEELLLEMEGLALDEEEGASSVGGQGRTFGNRQDGFDEDDYRPVASTSTSHFSSLTLPTSPTLVGTSLGPSSSSPSSARTAHTWRPSPGPSPSLAPYEPHSYTSSGGGSPSNWKIQLSPRLGPTYGAAGAMGRRVEVEVPDMSEELWPTAAAGASASTSPARSPRPQASNTNAPASSASTAPPPSSTSTAPSPSPAPSTPARRGWSEVARSSPSPSPAPSSPTPWSSSPSAPRSSLLADQLRASKDEELLRRSERESREEELRRREEEEMRFVLELSRAEEESRRVV